MSIIVSSIVEGVNRQNSIVNNVCVDGWTAEWAIIASNVTYILFTSTVKLSIKYTFKESNAVGTTESKTFRSSGWLQEWSRIQEIIGKTPYVCLFNI